jgi:hypothetical protein
MKGIDKVRKEPGWGLYPALALPLLTPLFAQQRRRVFSELRRGLREVTSCMRGKGSEPANGVLSGSEKEELLYVGREQGLSAACLGNPV